MRVKFTYLNHRGETREREVEPLGLEFCQTPIWGYQPGWFLRAKDFTNGRQGEPRSFALSRIILPEEPAPQHTLLKLRLA